MHKGACECVLEGTRAVKKWGMSSCDHHFTADGEEGRKGRWMNAAFVYTALKIFCLDALELILYI